MFRIFTYQCDRNLTCTALTIKESRRLRLAVPLHYDNGYDAALYQATPYLGLGLEAQWAPSERMVLGLHLHDALQFGGDVSEQPCRDGLQRPFHCGTGLPWTDATSHLRQSNVSTFGQVTVNWRL